MTEKQKLDRAMLRLEFFKVLQGWGTKVVKDGVESFERLNMEEIKHQAAQMVVPAPKEG